MAREEDAEEQYLEEMPSCLRDLFEQTSCEEDKRFANNAHSSAKSYKSILAISRMQLPPPLLTEEERAEMRQYRREAVKCETKLFERRREKYSDLILQVMSVMDRIQEQREAKSLTKTQCGIDSVRERTLTDESGEPTDTSRTLQQSNSQSASYEPDYRGHAWGVSRNGRNSNQEQFTKSRTENNGDQSRKVDSQLGYFPNSMESMLTSADESGIFKHQFPSKADYREQVRSAPLGFEGSDFPLSSTVDKNASVLKRPFSQLSFATNGMFSDTASDAPLRNKSVSFHQDRKGLEYDSLASTSLSVAFSDSSNATVYSVVEAQPRSTGHQQLHMDSDTKATHHRDYHGEQASTQSKTPQTNTRPMPTKQRTEKHKSQSTRVSKGPYISEQDKTLANLEKLRQKLLEEKQKHLDAIKQQELKRLRKQQKEHQVELDHTYASFHSSTPTHVTERPRSSSIPSTRTSDLKQSPESEHRHVIDRSSPLRRPLSLPPGEMYSILELSGEDLDLDSHDHSIEPESSSDKENHVVNEDLIVNRSVHAAVSQGAPRNITAQTNSGQNVHSSYSQRKDHKTSAVPRETYKFYESNGRDKFAKLSAHAKGFLTRLLMRTDKVKGLIKTIKDTRDVLEDMSREDTQTMQEKMLKENVESHLKAARVSLHDVFFKVAIKERMSYIAHSRSVAQTKQAKRVTRSSVAQSKLSAVTLRAIQRRQEGLEHLSAQSSVRQTENTEVKPKPEAREERKRKNWNIRVLKPQQGHTSPPLPDRTRSKKQTSRPTTAPERPLNSRIQKEDTSKRPQTGEPARGKPERPSRLSLGGGNSNQPAKRPGRKSLGGISQRPRMAVGLGNTNRTTQPRAQKRLSLPESAQPRMRAHVGTSDTTQRPQTSSEVKRSARTLAANFAK